MVHVGCLCGFHGNGGRAARYGAGGLGRGLGSALVGEVKIERSEGHGRDSKMGDVDFGFDHLSKPHQCPLVGPHKPRPQRLGMEGMDISVSGKVERDQGLDECCGIHFFGLLGKSGLLFLTLVF